jgi:hypothetical protein
VYPISLIPEYILGATHCFKGGGTPKPPPPPKPPVRGEAATGAAGRLRGLRKRKGFESTILTSGLGAGDETSIRKTLLGG